jgi:apolipoprotein N-acyltransferase
MGNYSLADARYRAAENDITVVRANFYGPSAIINAGGSIQTELPFGERGIVRGFIAARPARSTLYARFGSFPLYAGIALCVLSALYCALRKRFR